MPPDKLAPSAREVIELGDLDPPCIYMVERDLRARWQARILMGFSTAPSARNIIELGDLDPPLASSSALAASLCEARASPTGQWLQEIFALTMRLLVSALEIFWMLINSDVYERHRII